MDLSGVRIETERLCLTPICMGYAESIFVEFTDEVTQFMYPRPPEQIDDARQFVAAQVAKLRDGTDLSMVILNRGTRQFLGFAGLHGLGGVMPEVGVWLKMSAHGDHFGFEAVSALTKWARQNLECKALLYPVDERNTASRRIPERLGGSVARRRAVTNMSGRELRLLDYEIPLTGTDSPSV